MDKTSSELIAERLHRLASDIQFGAKPGEACFHQGALLRAIADAEVAPLSVKVVAQSARIAELEAALRDLLNTWPTHSLAYEQAQDRARALLDKGAA